MFREIVTYNAEKEGIDGVYDVFAFRTSETQLVVVFDDIGGQLNIQKEALETINFLKHDLMNRMFTIHGLIELFEQ